MANCSACGEKIESGAPWLKFKDVLLCSGCYIEMIPQIYKMRNMGDGGLINVFFEECVKMNYNLKYKKAPIHISKLDERIAKCFEPKD